ncbi:MAG: ABC transporter substrate-binding protein [Candidatus Tectomicrobia bacterium]|uniref:ABC transporter substrate-binding protein n=1 Tax=Tectimicrobiota bacterium TaxID=2528274 RepID=A0A932CM84_UNCTE|nr:ABC transporter substrate-binding protein [Candidatus Tectomicrobia bacterium]
MMRKVPKTILWGMAPWIMGVLLSSPVAWGGEPTNQLKQSVDRIISILTDPQYKTPGQKEERRAAIRRTADERFNWEEMSRRSLGPRWREISEAEKKEFVKLYSDLLEKNYISKIEDYSGEKVIYVNDTVDGDYATVQTKILTKKGTEVPLNYRLLKENNKWFIYDVVIAGVSLINNYRSQFNSILLHSSFKDLLEKMKSKQTTG